MHNLGLMFQATALSFQNSTALFYPDGQQISYQTLNELSNSLAHFLLARGVRRTQTIVILNTKHPSSLALMLACLKIGAIYCNLDERSPPERLHRILERIRPVLIVADHPLRQDLATQIQSAGWTFLDNFPDTFKHLNQNYSSSLPECCTSVIGTDPAYLMFTSGSTGFPKGAVITHANLINFIRWSQRRFCISPQDRLTNVNPIYFDNSVFDFYSALFCGAGLIPVNRILLEQPRALVESLSQLGATVWFSVPSMLVYLSTVKLLKGDHLQSLRQFIFGGEGFPKSELKKIWTHYSQQATFTNVYGPTECTCICSAYDISLDDFSNMEQLAPLGHLNEDFSYLILDEHGQSARKGELYLIGPNVGVGYYNDPERSDAAFVQNPLHSHYKEILYRTGDIVRLDDNGLLHFTGRMDNQIKHMGYRIELEEIESALNSLDNVAQSGVVYQRVNEKGGRIIAFVSGSIHAQDELRSALAHKLPQYMMPHEIRLIERFPKNQNGKIDRKQLLQLL